MVTKRLSESVGATITFTDYPTVKFYVKQMAPPTIDAGQAIQTTLLANSKYHTFTTPKLISLMEFTLTVSYNSDAMVDAITFVGHNQLMTFTWPDGFTFVFYGAIMKFAPGELVPGTQPTATITIQPTMENPSTLAETAPTHTIP